MSIQAWTALRKQMFVSTRMDNAEKTDGLSTQAWTALRKQLYCTSAKTETVLNKHLYDSLSMDTGQR